MPTKPLLTKDQLHKRLEYIAEQAVELGKTVAGETFMIDTITCFTHSRAEWEATAALIRQYGSESPLTHGKTLYVEPKDLIIHGNQIVYLGVREPDATRPEAGYPVTNFAVLHELATNNPNMTPVISGRGQALIEFKHPDFDIRAYAVAASEH